MNGSRENTSSTADKVNASRRRFLQASAVATASLATLVKPVHAAGDDTLKIALVGCGNRGTGAASNALQTAGPVKLWAMADAFADRLEMSLATLQNGGRASGGAVPASVAKRVDVPRERQFVGLDAFRHAIDAADVVLLCQPPGFRPEHFEYAVNQGKHVFMEKPVATDAPGVRRVLAAAKTAEEKGLKVGVGLQRHHDPRYTGNDRPPAGWRDRRCAYAALLLERRHNQTAGRSQRTDRTASTRCATGISFTGSAAITSSSSTSTTWTCATGSRATHPEKAVGMGGRLMRVGKDYGDIFDHHAVEYTYADGTKMFSYCRQMPGCEPLVGEFAVGSRGRADVGGFKINGTDGTWSAPRTRRGEKSAAGNPYQTEHDDLFAAIRSGSPYNEAEAGATATMTAILGRMATYSGRTVAWDDGFNGTRALAPETIADWDTAAAHVARRTRPVQAADAGHRDQRVGRSGKDGNAWQANWGGCQRCIGVIFCVARRHLALRRGWAGQASPAPSVRRRSRSTMRRTSACFAIRPARIWSTSSSLPPTRDFGPGKTTA